MNVKKAIATLVLFALTFGTLFGLCESNTMAASETYKMSDEYKGS